MASTAPSSDSSATPAPAVSTSASASASAFPELRLLYSYLSVAAVCAYLLGAPLLVSAALAGVALLAFVAAQLTPLSAASPGTPATADVTGEKPGQLRSASTEEGLLEASAPGALSASVTPSAAALFASPAISTPVAQPRLVKHLLAPTAVVAAGCLTAEPRQRWDELEDYLQANARCDQDEPAPAVPDTSCCFGHMPEMPSFGFADDGFDRY